MCSAGGDVALAAEVICPAQLSPGALERIPENARRLSGAPANAGLPSLAPISVSFVPLQW
jgi:hypothetical protein